jgi:hypothetical protein
VGQIVAPETSGAQRRIDRTVCAGGTDPDLNIVLSYYNLPCD